MFPNKEEESYDDLAHRQMRTISSAMDMYFDFSLAIYARAVLLRRIANVSFVYVALHLFGVAFSFPFGLAITQAIFLFSGLFGASKNVIGIVLSLVLVFTLYGIAFFIQKRSRFMMFLAIFFYGCDTLGVLVFQDWWALPFHVLALIYLAMGPRAMERLQQLEDSV